MNRAAVTGLVVGVLAALATALASPASACDPGSYYDPNHVICQPSPPAYFPYGPSNAPMPPLYPQGQYPQYPNYYNQ